MTILPLISRVLGTCSSFRWTDVDAIDLCGHSVMTQSKPKESFIKLSSKKLMFCAQEHNATRPLLPPARTLNLTWSS